jgi:CO/xanthine dehydrogenase Mo-binding subunit
MLRSGDHTATGQKLVDSVGSEAVVRRVLARSRFDLHSWKTPKTGAVRRGVGFSFFFHGAGFTGSGEDLLKGRVRVELTPGGRARVASASTEFGQGTLALFTAIAADSLEVEPEAIELVEPDTSLVPDSGPTVASRTCMIVGGCLARACRELSTRLTAAVGEQGTFAQRVERFLAGGGDPVAEVAYGSPADHVWDEERYRGDAYPAYGWAADVAEVEVDMDTFEVRVTRFLTAVDVGRALQPRKVRGQIEGGSLQAIGFAHIEVVSSREGRVLQDRMATCIVPTSLDAPPMEVELVEVPFAGGPFGAKGVGELPMDGGAPAVASAIEDATGLHVDRIPATPERLLELWLETHPEEESWRSA